MAEERILIVEDEEKIARFVELELLHEGYQVGKSAEDFADTGHPPDRA